jgi:hypothetical protein
MAWLMLQHIDINKTKLGVLQHSAIKGEQHHVYNFIGTGPGFNRDISNISDFD